MTRILGFTLTKRNEYNTVIFMTWRKEPKNTVTQRTDHHHMQPPSIWHFRRTYGITPQLVMALAKTSLIFINWYVAIPGKLAYDIKFHARNLTIHIESPRSPLTQRRTCKFSPFFGKCYAFCGPAAAYVVVIWFVLCKTCSALNESHCLVMQPAMMQSLLASFEDRQTVAACYSIFLMDKDI